MNLLTLLLTIQAGPLIDDAKLRELVEKAVPAVERAAGLRFKEAPLVRISTRAEVEKALVEELIPQMKVLAPEATPDEAREAARQAARTHGEILIGKFAWKDRVVHVIPSTLERLAEKLSRPEIRDVRTLRVVITHELVHALDQQAFDAIRRLGQVKTSTELEILNALIEGHAQHVTRLIYEKAGELADFEAFEKLILAGPASMSEGEKYFAEILTASVRFAYIDGRSFFDVLSKSGRPGYVADAFATPPATKNEIHRPEGFYEPKKAVAAFDPAPAFDAVADRIGREWSRSSSDVDAGMLRVAFGDFVEKKDVDAALKGLIDAKALVMQPKAAPGSRMLIVSLVRASDAEAARRLRDLSVALSKAKDGRMKEGAIRISASAYSTLKLEASPGNTFARKTIVFQGQDITVASLIGDVGAIQYELVFSGEAPDDEAMRDLGERLSKALPKP